MSSDIKEDALHFRRGGASPLWNTERTLTGEIRCRFQPAAALQMNCSPAKCCWNRCKATVFNPKCSCCLAMNAVSADISLKLQAAVYPQWSLRVRSWSGAETEHNKAVFWQLGYLEHKGLQWTTENGLGRLYSANSNHYNTQRLVQILILQISSRYKALGAAQYKSAGSDGAAGGEIPQSGAVWFQKHNPKQLLLWRKTNIRGDITKNNIMDLMLCLQLAGHFNVSLQE